MEPHGNIHHHQLQEYQLVASSSSSLSSLSCYGIGIGSAAHSDSTSGYSFLNMHGFNPYNTLNPTQHLEKTLAYPNSGSLNWDSSPAGIFLSSQFKQDLQFSARVKEEQQQQQINGSFMNKMELFPDNFNSPANNYARAGAVFRAFPSIDVSYLNHGLAHPNSFDESVDSNASNLLGSSRFSADLNGFGNSEDRFELLRESLFHSGNVDHIQQTHLPPLHSSDYKKISSSSDASAESKRTGGKMEPKRAQTTAKKSRLSGRVSSPPFKVRKEKLGDRIAALQQLVAPFGKTDTASVLMEAIGYIKFLQNQVETLSVPYMKAASRNIKTSRGSNVKEHDEEARRGLKSRGLCLVPVPCLSYIADCAGGGGGAVWPLPSPPHFGGAA